MQSIRKAVLGAALVGSTLTGGAIGAAVLNNPASASSASTQAITQTTVPGQSTQDPGPGSGDRTQHDPTKGGHQANGITEALLTGDTASKVKAAAEAAVPGGTVQRVENDAEGSPYEAHVTKSDGSMVTVKVDSSFKVTSTENGLR